MTKATLFSFKLEIKVSPSQNNALMCVKQLAIIYSFQNINRSAPEKIVNSAFGWLS